MKVVTFFGLIFIGLAILGILVGMMWHRLEVLDDKNSDLEGRVDVNLYTIAANNAAVVEEEEEDIADGLFGGSTEISVPSSVPSVEYTIDHDIAVGIDSSQVSVTAVRPLDGKSITAVVSEYNEDDLKYIVTEVPYTGYDINVDTANFVMRGEVGVFTLDGTMNTPAVLCATTTGLSYRLSKTSMGTSWYDGVAIDATFDNTTSSVLIADDITKQPIVLYFNTGGNLSVQHATTPSFATATTTLIPPSSTYNRGFLVGLQLAETQKYGMFLNDTANGNIIFVSNTSGDLTSWNTATATVVAAYTLTQKYSMSCSMVNGHPAIAFVNATNQLIYVRSSDVNGVAFPAVTIVNTGVTVSNTDYVTLGIVSRSGVDVPYICYHENGASAHVIVSEDENGATWSATDDVEIKDDTGDHSGAARATAVAGGIAVSYINTGNLVSYYATVFTSNIATVTYQILDNTGNYGVHNHDIVSHGSSVYIQTNSTDDTRTRMIRSKDLDMSENVVRVNYAYNA